MKKFLTVLLTVLLVLACCLTAFAETADTTVDAAEEVKVMTYEEFAAAAIDDQVVVETYVQAVQKYNAEYGNTSIYAQSEDGAYFIYRIACTEEEYALLTPGTKIRVTGYKAEWSGEVEIVDASFELAGLYIAEPLDVTALLGTDDLIKYQNMLVSFKGMTVEASKDADGNDAAFLYKWNGSGQDGDDLYFNASINGVTFNFTVETDLCDGTSDVYAAVKALKIGDVIDMEGFLYWYEGANPHITAVAPVVAAE